MEMYCLILIADWRVIIQLNDAPKEQVLNIH